jgi:hypothetical protein
MASRVVLLSPNLREARAMRKLHGIEMSALDADALVTQGAARVEIAQRGGELADALTLVLTPAYVEKNGGADAAWISISGFLRGMHGIREIDVPIP